MLNTLTYICGALVAVGGLLLGYLGVAGGFTNQRILALKILYGTLFFLLTGAFLYFYQNLRNQESQQAQAPTKGAYVFFRLTQLTKPLTVGKTVSVQSVLHNNGPMEAHVKFWDETCIFLVRPYWEVLQYSSSGLPAVTIIAPTEDRTQVRNYDYDITKDRFDLLDAGVARLYFYSRGEYQDEAGRTYSLPFCRFYDKTFSETTLAHCPDDVQFVDKLERPQLSTVVGRVEFSVNDGATVYMTVMNNGVKLLQRLALEGSSFVEPAAFAGPLEYTSRPEKINSFPVLSPGAQLEVGHAGSVTLTQQEIAEIESGTRRFFHYTTGWYEDEGGSYYPYEICFMYEPGRPTLRTCPAQYWPKNKNSR